MLIFLQSNTLPVIGVRVDSVPTALSGAQSGPQPLLRQANTAVPGCVKPSGSLDFSGHYLVAVRKRAYKRACDRASLRGGTYYRGRWHTARSLQTLRVQQQKAPHASTASRTHRAGAGSRQLLSRLHVLTWNAGGLSLAMFDELILLLDTSDYAHVSVVIIQETHWKHESTWRASGWSCVHSGCESESYTGILIMVRGKLVPHDLIRYDVVKPGRLLHVRIPFGPQLQDRSLDGLGIYQYPWDTRKPRAQLLEARAGIWKQLDVVLRRLPRRNLLFVCGDLNVQLPAQDRHVGTGIVLRNPEAQQATDSSAMLQIAVSHDLCAINTWRGPKQQAFTYSMGTARTLIDYIFVRASDADHTAKGCLPLTAFPVAAWRLDGRHRAIIGSISTQWSARTSSRREPCFDQEALLRAYNQDQTLPEVAQRFELLMKSKDNDASLISGSLLQACQQVHPVQPQVRDHQQVDRMQLVRGPITNMWRIWRDMRAVRDVTLRSIIRVWRLRVQFRAQKKAVEKASREQRKQRVHGLLAQAEEADRALNARGLYSIVRKLAPKQRYKPLQVKTEKGICMSGREEVAELKRFFGGVFCGTPEVTVNPWDIPFCPTLEAIEKALHKLPAHKAVPHGCAPSLVWKACAATVAPYIHATFEAMCGKREPVVSSQWKDGWMVLVPKAGKPLCRACDVRPLALQDPGGKAAIRTVKEAIQPYVDEYMRLIPQYAYLKHRDGQMAILRACAHLRQVREMVAGQKYTVHNQRDGHRRVALCGGLTLSLDLCMAFDVLPRRLVERSLKEANIPEGLISLIMAWLTDSSYHIAHAGEDFTLTPGCVLSPLIWTCVTGTMVRDLVARGISIAALDLYADDYLHQEVIQDCGVFEQALRRMGIIITYLQEQGLQVSMDKTVVLLRLAGTRCSMTWAKHTIKRKDREGHERLYIKVPTDRDLIYLPVVKEHKYMGIMATYYNFEDCTLMHRISAAKNNYARLKPFLRSRKRLSLPGRLRMWWTCVWSALRYALPSVGVTASGATTIRGLIATHLRALAVSPRHITGEHSTTLFARLGVDDPVSMIAVLANAQGARLAQLAAPLDQGAITQTMIQQAEWASEQWRLHKGSDSRSHMRLQRLADAQEGVPCPHCGLYFISELAVTTHVGHQHADLHQKVREEVSEMQAADMGVNGMPTCRFCLKKFHGWQNLKRHITNGRCPAMHDRSSAGASVVPAAETVTTTQPLMQQHALLQRLVDQQLDRDLIASEVRLQILQNCGLCRQWIADARQVKQHIRQGHRDIWNKFHSEVEALLPAFGRSITVPCGFCGTDKINSSNRPRHAKLCGVLFQTC